MSALLWMVWAMEVSWWQGLPLGASPPAELRAEHDYPWAAELDAGCGWWQGATLLCAPKGVVDRAYRRDERPVEGGARVWRRTAGMEWRSGFQVSEPAPEGYTAWRWGQRATPSAGWVGVEAVGVSAVTAPRAAPRAASLRGGEALGDALPGVLQALGLCAGPAVDELPIVMLYDGAGEARMLRVQAFLTEAPPDMACVAEALAAAGRPEGVGDDLELMLTLGR
ncbi:hypothetical protein L6R49_08195 [Myxococcota bacterium]|nr:hypothetical protein [Myxococcota bacterium]